MSSAPTAMPMADALAIEKCLSQGRLSSYRPPRVTCHDNEDDVSAALRLYRWNTEIAAALWTVMHVFEVTVRNAVSDAVTEVHGPRWTHDRAFQAKLPAAPRDRHTNKTVGYGPREDLRKQAANHATPGKVIPELKMVFWEKMLTARHDADFWSPHLMMVFPNLDPSRPFQDHRNKLRENFGRVRQIRNRMGHHESISDAARYDLDLCYTGMMDVLAWRSHEVHGWVDEMEIVSEVLLRRPS